jgi:hypothetical protein
MASAPRCPLTGERLNVVAGEQSDATSRNSGDAQALLDRRHADGGRREIQHSRCIRAGEIRVPHA